MSEGSRPGPSGPVPGESASLEDATLGGYLARHQRPPAFRGSDGHPYTVSMEVEKTANLLAPYSGYLVFPRWAVTGAGILGHLETPILLDATGRDEAEDGLGALTLQEVKDLLEQAISRRQDNQEE